MLGKEQGKLLVVKLLKQQSTGDQVYFTKRHLQPSSYIRSSSFLAIVMTSQKLHQQASFVDHCPMRYRWRQCETPASHLPEDMCPEFTFIVSGNVLDTTNLRHHPGDPNITIFLKLLHKKELTSMVFKSEFMVSLRRAIQPFIFQSS